MVRKLEVNRKEICDQAKINDEIKNFFEEAFKCHNGKSFTNLSNILNSRDPSCLTNEQKDFCEIELGQKKLFNAFKSMTNNKAPENDGLSKEFYEAFSNELNDPHLKSFYHAKTYKEFSTSQRQAVIKLLEKKDRDKRLIKNWRPISLLNTDLKIFSKALAAKLKAALPSLITLQKTAYVQNRYIEEGEAERLISDILDISDKLSVDGYLVTVDIEKAFDSLDHEFLLVVLKKFGFGNSFIDWIKILLTNHESCVINGGSTTSYFKLENGGRQGDPISAYLFILCFRNYFCNDKEPSKYKRS